MMMMMALLLWRYHHHHLSRILFSYSCPHLHFVVVDVLLLFPEACWFGLDGLGCWFKYEQPYY